MDGVKWLTIPKSTTGLSNNRNNQSRLNVKIEGSALTIPDDPKAIGPTNNKPKANTAPVVLIAPAFNLEMKYDSVPQNYEWRRIWSV